MSTTPTALVVLILVLASALPGRGRPAPPSCQAPSGPGKDWLERYVETIGPLTLKLPAGYEADGDTLFRGPIGPSDSPLSAPSVAFSRTWRHDVQLFQARRDSSVVYIDGVPVTPGGRGDHGVQTEDSCLADIDGHGVLVTYGRETGFGWSGLYMRLALRLGAADTVYVGATSRTASDMEVLRSAIWSIHVR